MRLVREERIALHCGRRTVCNFVDAILALPFTLRLIRPGAPVSDYVLLCLSCRKEREKRGGGKIDITGRHDLRR